MFELIALSFSKLLMASLFCLSLAGVPTTNVSFGNKLAILGGKGSVSLLILLSAVRFIGPFDRFEPPLFRLDSIYPVAYETAPQSIALNLSLASLFASPGDFLLARASIMLARLRNPTVVELLSTGRHAFPPIYVFPLCNRAL